MSAMRHKCMRVLAAVLVAVLACAGLAPAVRAQAATDGSAGQADPKAVARAKLVDGGELLKRGEFKEALARFKEAYELVPSPKIHYNFGLSYRGLGRPADAIEAFERFLAEAHDASPDLRANAERFRSELGQQVGTVVLTCDVDGADISVDGRSYGPTPTRGPLRLDPGPHQIVVEKAPAAPFTRKVELAAGQRLTVEVALASHASTSPIVVTPVPAAPESTVPPVPDAPPAPTHSWKWKAGWGLAAGGVALLGFGLVERMAANSKFREFNRTEGTLSPCDPDGRTREHGGAPCGELLSAGNSLATKATIGFVAGGVLAAGGAALLVLTWNETRTTEAATGVASLRCAPAFATPGLSCDLRF